MHWRASQFPPEGVRHGTSATPRGLRPTSGPAREASFSLQFRDRVCLAWLALFLGSLVAFVIAFVLLLNRLA